MINAKTNNGKTSMQIEGTLSVILSDLTCIIHSIYKNLKDDDEDIANAFECICKKEVMKLAFGTCDDEDESETPESNDKHNESSDEDSDEDNAKEVANMLFEMIMDSIRK